VLNGDLAETPVSATLQTLAEQGVTGCLHVFGPAGEEALIFLRSGSIYFIAMPTPGRQLGLRLVSSGTLLPEALAEALEAQEGALRAWRLGELLVRLGYVGQPVVEAFVIEQLLEDGASLLALTDGKWEFVDGEATREGISGGLPPAELMRQVIDRRHAWVKLTELVSGPGAVPRHAPNRAEPATRDLSREAWALLGQVDGVRPVHDLAECCGFTLFEATYVVAKLVHGGVLEIIDHALDDLSEDVPVEVESDDEPEGRPDDELEAGPAAWQAAALLSELSREQLVEPVAEVEPVAVAPEIVIDHPAVAHLDNDTASLMRELSFLGLDDSDDTAPANPGAPASPRQHAPATQKKRKGIFGR
jgi:hypothetical protein